MSHPPRPTAAARRQSAALGREQQAERARRQRRITIVGIATMVLFTAVVFGLTFAQVHRQHTATAATTGAGLQSSAAPWAPEYAHLPQRLAALRLPPNGDESYHIHAHLAVYIDGRPVPVPANVGISAAEGLESPMHTHDTTGVIHIEASAPSDAFTLGAFFDIWGVKLTGDTLGGYRAGDGKSVQVFVNGSPVADGSAYVLHRQDDVVVAYGAPGASPTSAPYTWPAGE